uniref:Uncharacterized protein n=1 Tax=Zea mays TaxID=4577 RepID=C0P329_MAIZE|nr:unknown [Zea mays]
MLHVSHDDKLDRHLCGSRLLLLPPSLGLRWSSFIIPRNQTRGGRSRRRRWPAGRTCRSWGPCIRSRCPACTDPPPPRGSRPWRSW